MPYPYSPCFPRIHKLAERDLLGSFRPDEACRTEDISRAFAFQSVYEGDRRDANLQEAVFVDANCHRANFKLADLRNADLSNATLVESGFEGAKVSGCILAGAKLADNPDTQVDTSAAGDGSKMISLREWLAQHPDLQPKTPTV